MWEIKKAYVPLHPPSGHRVSHGNHPVQPAFFWSFGLLHMGFHAPKPPTSAASGGFQSTSVRSQLGPDAPSLRPRLTSSRKETGQVLSDLKESRKENAALKEKARGALLGGKGSCQTTGVGLCGRVERVGCVERSVEVQGFGRGERGVERWESFWEGI